jgi:hydroxyacylglutathione hydrolase
MQGVQKMMDLKTDNQKPSEKQNVTFNSKEENLYYAGVFDIDAQELNQRKAEVILVDVRQPEEYQGDLGHIPESTLIALDVLPDELPKLPKDKTIVFVCRSGNRSARATAFALEQGFSEVYNLKGGMILWNELEFETEGNN